MNDKPDIYSGHTRDALTLIRLGAKEMNNNDLHYLEIHRPFEGKETLTIIMKR